MRDIVIAAVTVLLSIVAVQAQTSTQPAQPGPEHKQLGVFVGTWELDIDYKLESRSGKGTIACEWAMEGFSVLCRNKTTTGVYLSVYGYDPENRNYTLYRYWSNGTSDFAKGWVKGSTWTFVFDPNRFEGKMRRSQSTLQMSPDSYTAKWERSLDGEPWVVSQEVKVRRANP